MFKENIALKSEFTVLSWKASAFFIGGSLPLIILGQAVLAVWLSIGLLFGLLAMRENPPSIQDIKDVFFSNTAKITLIVLLIFASSALNSVERSYSIVRFFEMSALSIVAGLLVVILNKMPRVYVYFCFKVLGVASIIFASLTFVDAFVDIERLRFLLHGKNSYEVNRLEDIGPVLAVLSPFVWTWLFRLARKENNFWAGKLGVSISFFMFFVVSLCGGISTWLAIITGVFVYLLIGGRWHGLALNRWNWLSIPIGLLLSVVGYLVSIDSVYLKKDALVEKYVEYMDFAKESLEYLNETPVLGVGVNASRFLPTPDAVLGKSNSQNFLIQLLLETGFLGFCATTFLFCFVLYKLYEYAKVNVYGLAGVSSMVVFMMASMSNTSIFNAWWLVFFIALSALSIRLCRRVP